VRASFTSTPSIVIPSNSQLSIATAAKKITICAVEFLVHITRMRHLPTAH
jgi:hypothetical protein